VAPTSGNVLISGSGFAGEGARAPQNQSGVVDVHQDVVSAFLAESYVNLLAHGEGVSHVSFEHQQVRRAAPVRQSHDRLVGLADAGLIELDALHFTPLPEST